MNAPADNDLTDLVRGVLPQPARDKAWDVRIVDCMDDAGADLCTGTVCVHRTWRQSICGAGLSHVTRHHPLAVAPFESVDPRIVVENLRMQWRGHHLAMCQAVTIERYWHGRFTGDLIVGRAFIVRNGEGQFFADWNPARAVSAALKAKRSQERQRQIEARKFANLRNEARELIARLGASRPHDAADRMPLTPYVGLLPELTIFTLQRYGQGGVPLPAFKAACIDAIDAMKRDDILNLILRLGFELSTRQSLTPEEDLLFEHWLALSE